ncbi:hypothetical protein [Helicobacter suis]|nr:hypothetical protein [Helicobacter suis]BCD50350.1 hypothetical protein NHP194022_00210 [Helicobacter suis]BCD51226.1 hypothetical protein NHP194022_08970 [Helicobacter suis]BDR27261.1 hypothetical protein HSHS1_00220 [Helicobacter suis HS1]BDR27954.1 hypothetical protein HSHS1_07150 [Helicobacter suis HS1]
MSLATLKTTNNQYLDFETFKALDYKSVCLLYGGCQVSFHKPRTSHKEARKKHKAIALHYAKLGRKSTLQKFKITASYLDFVLKKTKRQGFNTHSTPV